jgi:ABC-type dipeptide/oligopeptide/nickel transport system ATPase component
VLVMEHGLMVEQGKTEDVIFNPQHEYTQRLLSDVPKLHEGASALAPETPVPEPVPERR